MSGLAENAIFFAPVRSRILVSGEVSFIPTVSIIIPDDLIHNLIDIELAADSKSLKPTLNNQIMFLASCSPAWINLQLFECLNSNRIESRSTIPFMNFFILPALSAISWYRHKKYGKANKSQPLCIFCILRDKSLRRSIEQGSTRSGGSYACMSRKTWKSHTHTQFIHRRIKSPNFPSSLNINY